MTKFRIYASNRLERLLQQMSEILRVPLSSVMSPECFLIPNLHLKHYLSMKIAEQLGISANISFYLPREFVDYLCAIVAPELHAKLEERNLLIWTLMETLPKYLEDPDFRTITGHLQRGNTSVLQELRLLQLCERIAYIFERYAIYRQDIVLRWEEDQYSEGEDEYYWQYILWNEIYKDSPVLTNAAQIGAAFKQQLNRKQKLPERIIVFGFSNLTRSYLSFLEHLARFTDVHFFSLNPCAQYWFDIETEENITRAKNRLNKSTPIDAHELHYEEGNALLASFGKTGRDFFNYLYEMQYQDEWSDYVERSENTVLSELQKDICILNDPMEPVFEDIRKDTSLRIHSCPNELREVEVLHHSLLWMFEKMPDLKPWEICVMMPHIETYTSYIRAVFSESSGANQNIPYAILDQSYYEESSFVQAFLKILEMSHNRLYASEVLSLLDYRPILEHFKITESDLKWFRKWIQEAGIRWGQNAQHRKSFGLPELGENTWETGLSRLLLGYATGEFSQDQLFHGILPACEIRGSETESLGKFLSFSNLLLEWVERLRIPKTLREWGIDLNRLLNTFLAEANDEYGLKELSAIREQLKLLITFQKKSDFKTPLELSTLRYYFEKYFQKEPLPYYNSFSGGVTFCTLKAMRGIPFRVIYILGLNEGVYPQISKPLNFDLLAKKGKAGDPAPSQEEKYAFLEAFISAKEKLWLSYVGFNSKKQAKIQPSFLITELMEQARKLTKKGSSRLVVEHPFEAYHPKYFQKKSGLVNYSRENFEAAKLLTQQKKNVPLPTINSLEYFRKVLKEPAEEERHFSLGRFFRFFENPTAAFFQQRLSLTFEDDFTAIEDTEPFTLGPLEQYNLRRKILKNGIEKDILAHLKKTTMAKGILPLGNFGEVLYDQIVQDISPVAQKIIDCSGNEERTLVFVEEMTAEELQKEEWKIEESASKKIQRTLRLPEINLASFHLFGELSGLREQGYLLIRPVRKRAKYLVQLWLTHLLYNLVQHPYLEASPRRSHLICLDEMITLKPISTREETESYLKTALEFYWNGLQAPLAFFPGSSFAYVNMLVNDKTEEQALNRAKGLWKGFAMTGLKGEGENPYLKRCYGDKSPIENDFFKEISRQFWLPFFTYIENVEKSKV